MPTTPSGDAKPGLGSRTREPDLGFTQRKPRDRKDLDSLLGANDRRGGLAADDLRKSREADRTGERTAPKPVEKVTQSPEQPRAPEPLVERERITEQHAEVAAPQVAESAPRKRAERPRAQRGDKHSLYIGAAIQISQGHITGCDSVVVDGHLDAQLDDARVLEISQSGAFTGTATVEFATVDGTFDGELSVTDRLVVTETGRVSGKIRYARIEVEPGGVILGDLGSLPD